MYNRRQTTYCNVVWCIYCMRRNETNERDKLFAKELKRAHDPVHVIKFVHTVYQFFAAFITLN